MVHKWEWKRMMAGQVYDPMAMEDPSWKRMQEAQWVFNHSRFWEDRESLDGVRACLGQAPEDLVLTPPVYFDHGDRIFFGQSCYANTGLTILDAQEVRIGNQVFIGPHVSIYTVNHPLDAEVRSTGLETARPVSIGDRVWIGGRVVINPGVSIGSDTVLASGSVVTKDVPSGVLAGGNPCRVIRPIGAEDTYFWQDALIQYRKEREEEQKHSETGNKMV